MNHWSQQAILITDYSLTGGATGIELLAGTGVQGGNTYIWPPAALDMEYKQRKWQAVLASDNIYNGNILSLLSTDMKKGAWELLFLLITSSTDTKTLNALLDTGLSPRQGFIAYLRLLEAALKRSEAFNDIPDYRKIKERDLVL